MAGFFGVLMTVCAAAFAAAFAINFFWRVGAGRAFACAGILIGAFLLFWASGVWEGASRHSWGVLAPFFALLMAAVWLAYKFVPPLAKYIYKIIKDKMGPPL